jgi:hypothetical protein
MPLFQIFLVYMIGLRCAQRGCLLPIFYSGLSYKRDSSLWKSMPHTPPSTLKSKALCLSVQNRTSLHATLNRAPPSRGRAVRTAVYLGLYAPSSAEGPREA